MFEFAQRKRWIKQSCIDANIDISKVMTSSNASMRSIKAEHQNGLGQRLYYPSIDGWKVKALTSLNAA
jgi:hypothetical protein